MINNIFYLVIFIFAFSIGIVETISINTYQKKDCKIAKKAIAELNKCKIDNRDYIKVANQESEIIKWFSQHLKGEFQPSAFKLEQDQNGDFILLSYPSILGKPVPRSPVSFAPALLTAIGILGTFTGIFLGLQGVDLGNISETQQLIAASQKLLMGMKTSFSTSLFGLGAAITFIIFLSLGAQQRTRFRNSLRKKLNDIAFLENPAHLLSRLDNEGNLEVAKTLQTVANNLSGLNADVIANAIKSAIASPDSPLVWELKQLRELQESQGKTVESLVKQLRTELIEPVVTRLDQSAALTKEASAAVTNLKNELGGISQSLAGAVTTIQSFQQDTLIKLQEFTIELRNILGEFQTDTKGVLEDVASEINRAVEQSIQGMEQQRTIFKEDVERREKLIQQIEQSMDKIQQTVKVTSNLASAIGLSDSQRLAEQQAFFREIGQSANQVTKQYSTMIDRFNDALNIGNEQLTDYLKQANETYSKSVQDVDKAAADICNKLNETSHGLMSAAELLVSATHEFKHSSNDNDLIFAGNNRSK